MIGKLKGRSVHELTDRLAQLGRAISERQGFMRTPALPAAMQLAPVTPWPACDSEMLRRYTPHQDKAALLALADGIVRGTFSLLGLRDVSYGSPVNWHRDPLSGREAPLRHWSRVPYLDETQVGDHKVIWELNRHQWFITLGQAWRLTGDDRYARTAARLLREWLDSNPPKQGINWCSALELAFRVQSWIHGLRLFAGAAELRGVLLRDLVASAALQIDHVVHNLSTWFSPNTHLTGEALAMLSAGAAWPELPDAVQWRSHGWKILCDELPKQLRADGVYFEQSAWYQAYTLDFYLLALAWAQHASLPVPMDMHARIRDAARALRAVTRPDGTLVRLGDDDGGHALPLVPLAFGDATASLWRAAHVLNDDALVPPTDAGRSTLLWLEGHDAFVAKRDQKPTHAGRSSVALPEGGWMTLAERGPNARQDHWLVMDGGPHGALSYAHAHADALGIDLSVHGVPVLVDPGTGAYGGALRRRYRSTGVHNTVTVDGVDSSEQGTAFAWRSAAVSTVQSFAVSSSATFCAASHDGYRRLADPVRHHRSVLRIAGSYWLVFDTIEAIADHAISLTLQAAHGAHVTQHSTQQFEIMIHDVRVHVALDPRFDGAVQTRTVSPAYALELPAPAITGSGRSAGRQTYCCAIAADGEAGSIAVQSEGHGVWRIVHRAGTDMVALGDAGARTFGPATFDGSQIGSLLAVLGADEPHRIVAAGAGTLHLAGQIVTLGANDIHVARRASDGTWTTES